MRSHTTGIRVLAYYRLATTSDWAIVVLAMMSLSIGMDGLEHEPVEVLHMR